MRRWIVADVDDAGGYFPHVRREPFDNSVFLSMPHRDTLLEILNKAKEVGMFCLYTPPSEDPALCQGAPLALCNGGGGPDHAYSSVSGSNEHIYRPPAAINVIATNAGDILTSLLNGFLDKDSNRAPAIFAESFVPPDKNGG